MSKEERIINYYVLCNKLKYIIRTGWIDWKVNKNRLESVAEHIYGTQMLAIAMKSEYNYDIDIMKVIYMLAIHELGETIIGDLTQFQIEKEDKIKIEHEAGCVDLNNQSGNETYNHPDVQKLLNKGYSFSEMWLSFGQNRYNYDDNFMKVSEYVKNNKLN